VDEQQALRTEVDSVVRALNEADVDWISAHYLPEATRFHQRGRLDIGWTDTKADEMRQRLNAGMSFDVTDVEVADVRIYGNTGITAGHFDSELTLPGGQKVKGLARFTYVWVRSNGDWKEVHHHVSDFHQWGT
jgi:ketosteroid isomerase-like protein